MPIVYPTCHWSFWTLRDCGSAKTDFALAGSGADGLGIDDHVCTLAFTSEYS